MTGLKVTLAIDDLCNLTVTENSGYYDVDTNPTGFLPESNIDAPTFGVYKLSQGYFINILLYNKYNTSPIVTNATEGFYTVTQPSSSTYANNFTPTVYALTSDGTYTLKRYFIMSDVYYNAVVGTSVFTGHDVYYTDGTSIYQVISGTPTIITVAIFLSANLANATVVDVDTSFISTCELNACYFKLMTTLLNTTLGSCPTAQTVKYTQAKDLIYMTLESIKYLQDNNAITQIQKLIEAVDGCCSICSSLALQAGSYTSGGCGCG